MVSRDPAKLDDLDLKIIHALQIQPRASWTLVGSCIGVDPATASRRWQRLIDVGAAWISCFPLLEPPVVTAVVEVQCDPGRTVGVAATLARNPHSRTLQIQSGTFDIGIVAVAANIGDLRRYVLDRISVIEGVQAVRTMPVMASHRDASQWRLRVLDQAAERRLAPPVADPATLRREAAVDWDVIAALGVNPRVSVEELATMLDVSPPTARRRLDTVMATRQVELMCELALPLSPWPTQVTFWGNCRADKLAAIAAEVSNAPGVIAVFATLGESSLDIAVRVSSLEHVWRFESTLARRLPDLEIVNRLLVLRLVKFGGQIIDEHGFAESYVPIDVRHDPVPRRSTTPRTSPRHSHPGRPG